ncbi:DUF1249 domain-containing protein [Teredinibacter haidensis]|mgnify:CR=1 FL=1|uniref:DUF1249 domain-containing protein n=1 Tax=Teredinibacter haidensis TaxID=2731755 RepID=UPI000A46D65B|nr:DUF1249 domain-containing protein [Teredinibacter haidensis]
MGAAESNTAAEKALVIVVVYMQSKKISVNLKAHHAQCELNFHRMLNLMPRWKDGENQWLFRVGANDRFQVRLRITESARYTTTVEVLQHQQGLEPPRLCVRLYHDANMAEIISWDRHRHWLPKYNYPNPQMYMPDEKLELNRFLGDWLEVCHSQGYASLDNCETVLVSKK